MPPIPRKSARGRRSGTGVTPNAQEKTINTKGGKEALRPRNVESKQPCWTCKKACGGCSWTEVGPDGKVKFDPIPGWSAEKSVRSRDGKTLMESYQINYCPEYEQEEPREAQSFSDTQRVRGLTLAHLTNRQIALLMEITMADVRTEQGRLRKEGLL